MGKPRKKKQKANNVEELMKDYARAILQALGERGCLDGSHDLPKAIKAASDEFLDGCVQPLLKADVGAIIRLVRTPSASGTGKPVLKLAKPPSNGNGGGSPTSSSDIFNGLFEGTEDDYYDDGIDF